MNILNELGEYTFISRYALYQKDLKKRESFKEAVGRYREMMLTHYASKGIEKEIHYACEAFEEQLVLGSQRLLQFAGPAFLKNNCRGYNCWGSYCDRLRFFQEAFYILLSGGGVGFSVQKHHIDKLPNLHTKALVEDKIYTISDDIENWSNAVGVLLSSYFENPLFPEYQGYNVIFDYSQIRPEGSPFSHGVGLAPGHKPLEATLEKIRTLLKRVVNSNRFRLKPIEAYDVIMHISDAVLSGGIRRSATLCIFSPDDEEMLEAKIGNWYHDNPQRARSNNSAILLRNKTSFEEFDRIVQYTKQYGEPGFIWADSLESMHNPCQSKEATVFEKDIGPISIRDLDIGDKIWSKEGWTTVLDKRSTGIQPTYVYTSEHDAQFYGTRYHNVISEYGKMEIDDATTVEVNLHPLKQEWHFERLLSRKYLRDQEVWDITVDNSSHTYWSDGMNVSNCVEINFWAYTSDGQSGWEACNLTTQNGSKIKTVDDWRRAITAATILGTLQAGFTSFEYLGNATEDICRREALLGVSLTGWMDSPKLLLDPELQKEMAGLAKKVNAAIAAKIGINPAARITCVKPEGSTSCMLGTASGIHPHHSRRFIRRIQENRLSAPAQFYQKINPQAVEESVWSSNQTDLSLMFPVAISGKEAIVKDDLSAVEFLKTVRDTQINWVIEGKNLDLCTAAWLQNNVSNTCIVKENEWADVTRFIYDNRNLFTAVSLISETGDKDYEQAPFTAVLTAEELIEEYGEGAIFTSGLIEEALTLFSGRLWKACDALFGLGEDLTKKCPKEFEDSLRESKLRWIERVKKFAKKYVKGDIKKTSYLLKDVYGWKLFSDLTRSHKKVNWDLMVEETNTTLGTKEVACGGGACLI